MNAQVSFKTKVKRLEDGRLYIIFKRKIGRTDCNLKAYEHRYYNSDLFETMLNRAYAEAIGNLEWATLCNLPNSVSVDTSGFLAVVKVDIEVRQ